jgi:hypothetical protein
MHMIIRKFGNSSEQANRMFLHVVTFTTWKHGNINGGG